jgi:dipeptidyl aminopeptidase/acylaminoacyl peptidase
MGDRPLAALRAQNLSRQSWLYDCFKDSIHRCSYSDVAWSPDGSLLSVVADQEQELVDHRQRAGKPWQPIQVGRYRQVFGSWWSPDGRVLAVTNYEGVFLVRERDHHIVRLSPVRVSERILGLVDDEQGHFAGDDEACARVVPGISDGRLQPRVSQQPDLLKKFFAGSSQ